MRSYHIRFTISYPGGVLFPQIHSSMIHWPSDRVHLTPGAVRFQLMSPSAVRLIMISRDGVSMSHEFFTVRVRNVRCAVIFGHKKKALTGLTSPGEFRDRMADHQQR